MNWIVLERERERKANISREHLLYDAYEVLVSSCTCMHQKEKSTSVDNLHGMVYS
jgi:hypothetical protein